MQRLAVAPRADRVAAFVEEMAPQVACELVAVASSREAVADADVVSLATSSSTPVVAGDDLAMGTHINGVGSFRLDMRELDERAVTRCTRIVVDLRESRLARGGRTGCCGRGWCYLERTVARTWRPTLGPVTWSHAAGRHHVLQIGWPRRAGFVRSTACDRKCRRSWTWSAIRTLTWKIKISTIEVHAAGKPLRYSVS